MMQDDAGKVITSISQIDEGQKVEMRLKDGIITSKVESKGDKMSETKTFAETLKELEAIVAELERGIDLDKTLTMFEQGTELLKQCKTHLEEEGKIREWSLDETRVDFVKPKQLQQLQRKILRIISSRLVVHTEVTMEKPT